MRRERRIRMRKTHGTRFVYLLVETIYSHGMFHREISTRRRGREKKGRDIAWERVSLINYLLVIRRYRLGSFFFVFSFDKRKSEVINSRNFARHWIPSRIKLMNLFGKEWFIPVFSILSFFLKLRFCWLNFVLINLKRSYSSIVNIDKLTGRKLCIIKFL